MKTLKDYTFKELVDGQAGQTLIELGKGTPMREIVYHLMELSLLWRFELEQDKEKE